MTTSSSPDESAARERLQRAVGDRYEVLSLLGRGGFAEVFEARDPRLDRSVAVKVLRSDIPLSPGALERFQREARAIARLRHPHVVDVYTVDEKDGVAFYVMPLVRGETLGERLEREGRLPPTEAERILLEAAAGLGAAHAAGLVHRDVKPDNILLEGDVGRVVLTDFGIAKAVESEGDGLTQAGVVLGTPHFLSPEQATGEAVDHRSDLYALGVVGYRMVAGTLPLDAPTPRAVVAKHVTEEPEPLRSVRSDCPEILASAVQRCLAKDPERRFQTAGELVAALRGEERPLGAPDAGSDEETVALGGSPSAARRPDDLLRPIRRDVAAWSAVAVVAAAADLTLSGSLGFSLPVVLVAAVLVSVRLGALRRQGRGTSGRSRAPGAGELSDEIGETDPYGGHAAAVRASRSSRAAVLRLFQALSRAEQERFPELLEAVDAVAHGIERDARRLGTLAQREAELARSAEGGGGGTGEVLAGEIAEARERIAGDLTGGVEALERIRHWLVRSGGADSEAVHDQLATAVARALAATRGRSG